jgi:hypothetical protein
MTESLQTGFVVAIERFAIGRPTVAGTGRHTGGAPVQAAWQGWPAGWTGWTANARRPGRAWFDAFPRFA